MKQYILIAWKAWKKFGMKIASIISFVLLLVLYLVIFAPFGIVMTVRFIFNRKKIKASYWEPHDATGDTLHMHQF